MADGEVESFVHQNIEVVFGRREPPDRASRLMRDWRPQPCGKADEAVLASKIIRYWIISRIRC